ncbi:MAG: cupin domain-containing protein [Acidimicrobiia bacterium]|nr:cupin domain-containing protein [Acidimicrobiia bacterium]
MSESPFELSSTFVHLGLGASATPVPDFEWSGEFLETYAKRFASDGDDGRLVCITPQSASWDVWERHPAGEELVVLLSGRSTFIQEVDGAGQRIELEPGQAFVNPTNVWHTSDVHEPGEALFVTPGRGTEHRPR